MENLLLSGLILFTVGLNTLAQILFKFGAGNSFLSVYLLGGVAAMGSAHLSTFLF